MFAFDGGLTDDIAGDPCYKRNTERGETVEGNP